MKTKMFAGLAGPIVLLASGCVYSHRQPVVYTPVPTVVAPVSERSVVRVYPEASTVVPVTPSTTVVEPSTTTAVATPRATVAAGDLAMADSIRRMFAADPALATAARNVRISVINGQITMTGTVLTEHDRSILHSAIGGMPGVNRFDDRVQVDLNR